MLGDGAKTNRHVEHCSGCLEGRRSQCFQLLCGGSHCKGAGSGRYVVVAPLLFLGLFIAIYESFQLQFYHTSSTSPLHTNRIF